LEQKAYLEYWIKQFITLIALISILEQIHSQFEYTRTNISVNRSRLSSTLYAVSQAMKAYKSKGNTTEERIVMETNT